MNQPTPATKDKIESDLKHGDMIDLVLDHVEDENYDDALGALYEATDYLNRALQMLEELA